MPSTSRASSSATTAADIDGALRHLERVRHPTIARSAALDRLEAAHRAGRDDGRPQLRAALLVRSGLGNREIAARLFLSPRTVEYHLSNAYRKLGVRSRGELAQLRLS